MSSRGDGSKSDDLAKYLKANLLLQLRGMVAEDAEQEKPEILLFRAGFTYGEIAELLGKKYDAVHKVIERAGKEGKEDAA